jgi:hypothetical protein
MQLEVTICDLKITAILRRVNPTRYNIIFTEA